MEISLSAATTNHTNSPTMAMKPYLTKTTLLLFALALTGDLQVALNAQTTATWTGGGGDGDWNTALNWDQGAPPADVTTNAVIGAGNTVNYSSPMAAGSF